MSLMFSVGCCCKKCTFFSDEFGRADSDTIGNGWNEDSGDGDIATNKLSTTSSNAVFTQAATQPDGDPDVKVSVLIGVATSGDIVRILLDYLDASNYWFAEVKIGTGAYLKIFQRSGGSNTEKVTQSITASTGSYTFCASIYGGVIRCNLQNGGSDFGSLGWPGTFSNPAWGIGTGTITGTVTFDDLIASRTSEKCPPCITTSVCDQVIAGTAPDQFLLEVSGFGNTLPGCCNINLPWILPRNPNGLPQPGFCTYYGTFEGSCTTNWLRTDPFVTIFYNSGTDTTTVRAIFRWFFEPSSTIVESWFEATLTGMIAANLINELTLTHVSGASPCGGDTTAVVKLSAL